MTLERDLARLTGRGVGTVLRGVAGIGAAWGGAIVAGIGAALWPSPTAPADIPGFREEAARRRQQEAVGQGPGENFYEPAAPVDLPPEPTPFGQRVLDAAVSGNVYDREWLAAQIGANVLEEIAVTTQRLPERAPPARDPRPESNYPPSTVPPPPSAPRSQTTTPAGPRGGRVVRRVVTAMQNPAARFAVLGLGVVGAIKSRRGSRGGTSARTASPIAPGATIGTLPLPAGTPYTGFMPGAYPGSSTSVGTRTSSSCSCPPKKKRGPARKCLERAPVVFKSGRRRGKAAGTKCLRWEK